MTLLTGQAPVVIFTICSRWKDMLTFWSAFHATRMILLGFWSTCAIVQTLLGGAIFQLAPHYVAHFSNQGLLSLCKLLELQLAVSSFVELLVDL